MRKRTWPTAMAFLAPAAVFYALFVLLPIGQTLWFSLWTWRDSATSRAFAGLANYAALLHDATFLLALRNNLLLVVLSLLIQLPIAFALAVLLGYVRRGRGFLRTAYFAPMVLPTVAVGVIWMFIYEPGDGLLARLLALFGASSGFNLGNRATALLAVIIAISWRYIGFHMVLFMAGLEAIPEELYEAARLDGASEPALVRHVTLPLMWPVIGISAVLSIVGSLKYFDLIWVMTRGGPYHASELVATYVFKTGIESLRYGYGSAMAAVLLVLALGVTTLSRLLFRRRAE